MNTGLSTELDVRDQVVQQHVPAVMMPQHTNFPPLKQSGHRFIVAADGLWLEVKRPWLHLVWPVAGLEHERLRLPYGEVLADEITYAFDVDSPAFERLLELFAADARAALPNECAACLVWDENVQQLHYLPLPASEASPGGVTYARPKLLEHQHLAVDLHSHGAGAPFFSQTDDDDDAGEVKLAYVLGSIGTDDERWAVRLCALGAFIEFHDDEADPT